MAKKRKQANETEEDFKKRCAEAEPGQTIPCSKEQLAKHTADERIDNLENGMEEVVRGMNAIMLHFAPPAEEEAPKQTAKVIDLPDANINIGEISLRRDVALFLQERVKYVLASGQRPGWTAEKEIEMMVKKTMQSAKATTQSAESRQSTLSGEQRTN